MPPRRRIAAILYAELMGLSDLRKRDADAARYRLERYRHSLSEEAQRYQGGPVMEKGDGHLCLFSDGSAAAACALELQRILQKDSGTPLRIGIHKGEAITAGQDVFGEGVAHAAQIGALASGGSVLLSETVCQDIADHRQFAVTALGQWKLEDVEDPVKLFALSNDGLTVPSPETIMRQVKKKEKISAGTWIAIAIMVILMIIIGAFIIRVFVHSTN